MALEWARHVAKQGRVIILAPLAVAQQIAREGVKFGVPAVYRRADEGDLITVTNYDMLHAFDVSAFTGVVLDESSILKSFTGATQKELTQSFASTPFRLCCTATPAPNDFTELGTHAEFLGVRTRAEMLAEFFVHDGGATQDWRLKGHAVASFWRWVATWGAVVKRPSDLGHDDGAFALPDLRMHDHVISVGDDTIRAAGRLFADDALTLGEQRAVRRATVEKRAEIAAKLCENDEPAVVWVDLNDEGDAVAEAIRDAVQVAGSDSRETKEDRLVGFADGKHRVMVSKVSLAGFGLNWQHCGRVIFIGPSHSYEQTYQAIRRCWRFGRTKPVDVHVIRTDADGAIVQNMRRKVADAERMAAEMTAHVGAAVRMAVTGTVREWNDYLPSTPISVPSWLNNGDES